MSKLDRPDLRNTEELRAHLRSKGLKVYTIGGRVDGSAGVTIEVPNRTSATIEAALEDFKPPRDRANRA